MMDGESLNRWDGSEFMAGATLRRWDGTVFIPSPAPVILAPVISSLAYTDPNLTLNSDEAGTLYGVLTSGATPPTATQIEAGKDSTGAAAAFGFDFSLASGANSDSPFTLAPDGTFYLHAAEKDAAGNYSNVLTLGVTVTFATDTTPTAFSFTDQTDVAGSTLITSNTITVAGINASTAISVTGGEYKIGAGAYTSASGTVVNGNTVTLRRTSSGSNSTGLDTVLTIGGVSDTWTITTAAAAASLTRVGVETGGVDNNNNFNIAFPAGITSGMTLVMMIAAGEVRGLMTPAGWTLYATHIAKSNTRYSIYWFQKTASGSETGNQAITASSYGVYAGAIIAYSDSTGLGANDNFSTAYSTDVTAPSITAIADSLILRAWSTKGSTADEPGTPIIDIVFGTNNLVVQEQGPVSAGATGALVATTASANYYNGSTMEVKA